MEEGLVGLTRPGWELDLEFGGKCWGCDPAAGPPSVCSSLSGRSTHSSLRGISLRSLPWRWKGYSQVTSPTTAV